MRFLKWLVAVLLVVVVIVVAGVMVIEHKAEARFKRTYTIDLKYIPIPFPLTPEEVAELNPPAGMDLSALALQRAIARGKHYASSRGGCIDCHGNDFAGGVIVDNPAMGRWVAPNITRGGRTKNYTSDDWVKIIRHGVKPDGTAATMPSEDFANFSDQEISDIAAYVESLPAVDKVMPATKIGPMFAFLTLIGKRPIAAEVIDHRKSRPEFPPAQAQSLVLGAHLVDVCRGCHGKHLSGGRIPAGDPSWPPAANLTFDTTGISGWTLADFTKALREGIRPDGSRLDPAMPVTITKNFNDDEVASLFMYLQSIPKRPMGQG